MMEESNRSGGIGFAGFLAIVFITLKLTGVIDWSWWLVTLPLWGGLAFIGVLIILLGIFNFIVKIFNK